MLLEPRQYQLDAVRWLYSKPYGALFGDLGVGKTAIVLLLLEVLRREEGGKTLLIAPKNVKDLVWAQEAKKFELFRGLVFSTAFAPGASVHLVNPESLHKVPDWLAYNTLIIDESESFKSPSSVRFDRLSEMLPLFCRRYILTASPTPNGYEDLWAQIYICDLGLRLGRNITQYRDWYFRPKSWGYGYDINQGAEEQINYRIADIVHRIDRNDVLTLPEKIDVEVPVHLGSKNLAIYRQLERDLIAELEKDTVVAMSAIEMYAKCKQFTGGFLYSYPEDLPKTLRKKKNQRVHWIHREKLHALGELHIEKNFRPFLVVYQYDAEGRAIAARFKCPRIHGGSKGTEGLIDRWNRGEIPMLAAQIETVARGLNLQFGGRDLVIYSIPDRMGSYFQVVGRLHRSGATKNVYIYHLVCQGTVDEMKLQPRLNKKLSRQALLLAALKNHFKK